MSRSSWHKAIAVIALAAVEGACLLTRASEVDALGDGVCPVGLKACPKLGSLDNQRVCTRVNDPQTGCSVLDNCSPCIFRNGVAKCAPEGTCTLAVCDVNFANCSRDGRGCESDLLRDPKNCGGCGNLCSAFRGTPGCESATCVIRCLPGFANCNAIRPTTGDGDGCETDTSRDDLHCGGCGQRCAPGTRCIESKCQ